MLRRKEEECCVRVEMGQCGCFKLPLLVYHHAQALSKCLKKATWLLRPITFFSVFYNLANGFLQAVCSQHELFTRPEDLWSRGAHRAHRAVPCGATDAARPIPIFSLLSNGGRWVGQRGRCLGFIIQGLEERVQLFLQDRALDGG